MLQRIKQKYHWLIIGLVFLEMIAFGGIINSFSVFIIPLCESLQVTRGAFAVATVPYNIATFVSTLFSGYLFHRWGYKRAAILSLFLAAAGMGLMSCAASLTVFAISRVLFALGYGACFTAGAVRITRDWFWKHQGLMIGLVSMGTGIGGSLMTLLLTGIIENAGWQAASRTVAVLLILVAGSYLLLFDRPEVLGLRPYGFGTSQTRKTRTNGKDGRDWEGYTLKDQMKQPAFYLMNFCLLVCCACMYITSMVVAPHFQDLGYSPSEAATYQSVFMLTLAVSKMACGGLSDRLGAKTVSVGCVVCAIVGQGMLGMTAHPVLCYLGIVLLATGLCMTSSMVPLLAAPLFGYRGSTYSNGIFLAMTAVANVISTPVTNFSYDQQGSYMPIFRVSATVNIGVLALIFLLFALADKEKKKFLKQKG